MQILTKWKNKSTMPCSVVAFHVERAHPNAQSLCTGCGFKTIFVTIRSTSIQSCTQGSIFFLELPLEDLTLA